MDEQQWTPWLGMQQAAVRLALRSAVAFVIWTGLVWVITPVLNFLTAHWAIWAVTGIVLAAPGVAIGCGLGRKLSEIAGMTGFPLLVMACAFGWAVVYFGVLLADTFRTLGDWQHATAVAATGFWVTLWLVRATLLET